MQDETSRIASTNAAWDAAIQRVARYADRVDFWPSDEPDFTVFKCIMDAYPDADVSITDVTAYQAARRFHEEYGL